MVVRTTVMDTARVSCSATRGYVDVAMAGRATSVTLRWKLTVKVATMKTMVSIDFTVMSR